MSDVTGSDDAGVESGSLVEDFDVEVPTQFPHEPLPVAPPINAISPQTQGAELTPSTSKLRLTGAEQFWYVLQCICFGFGYIAKVPTKKALSELGLTETTPAEKFWYIVLCIYFGVGYFAKVPIKKALSDAGLTQLTSAEQFWYILLCLYFGAGYMAKVPTRKALSDVGLIRMTDAGQFWYVMLCIYFGVGYFSKVPHKKALSELAQIPSPVGRLMTQIGVKEPVEIRSAPKSPGHPTAMVETKSFLPRVGGSSTAVRFMDDEAGYAEWLRTHPQGYVLNCCARQPQASYLPLHRATCSTISGRPTRGDTWTVAYIKVCADTAQELENWAREWTGALPRPCGRCHP